MQKRFSSEGNYYYGPTHEKAVGPHYEGQFKIVFTRQDYAEVVNYLTLHRPVDLSVLIHPHTLDAVGTSPEQCVHGEVLGRLKLHTALICTHILVAARLEYNRSPGVLVLQDVLPLCLPVKWTSSLCNNQTCHVYTVHLPLALAMALLITAAFTARSADYRV